MCKIKLKTNSFKCNNIKKHLYKAVKQIYLYEVNHLYHKTIPKTLLRIILKQRRPIIINNLQQRQILKLYNCTDPPAIITAIKTKTTVDYSFKV